MTRDQLESRVKTILEQGFQKDSDATEAVVVQVCGAPVFSWIGLKVPQLWELYNALQPQGT